MARFGEILYRPPENHLGVIYWTWTDRFCRFITADQRRLVWPLRYVFREICLNPRTAESKLDNVFTSDQVRLNVHLKTFYRVDPRITNHEQLIQVLHFPEEAWATIIKTNIEEIARNRVFIGKTCDELFTSHGRQELRQALSEAIAERVRGFGMIVNPHYGVAIVNLQPNDAYLKALDDQSAANAQSQAAIRRVLPMMEQLGQGSTQDAWRAVLMQVAAAIAKDGNMPDIFMPNSDGGQNGIFGNRRRPPDQPNPRPPRTWPPSTPSSD